MKLSHIFVLILGLAAITPSFGQKQLQKPYTEWSKEEATKVASDPPWASQYQSERGLDATSIANQQREQSNTRLSGSDRGNRGVFGAPIPIVIRLHSALPIRQAMVRLQQIEIGYDKMNSEEKAKFDASRALFLECKICKDYYVVTLTKFKDKSSTVNDGIFQSLKIEDLKGKVWLENDKGERRELTQFTPPKSETDSALFFFKRTDEAGTPFFTSADKAIKFMFSNELRDNKNAYSGLIPRLFEFKAAKMVVEGKLEF
ncbi:MAG TPA: hypothetical protein VMZ26_10720 [Pyrinomonadaceae bacterium]|nr:hypothetical protein [Pyrinomonadaceae bacterium]